MRVEEGESLRLTTADGKTVRARALVLATNAYTSKLGYLRRAVAPFFDYVAITAPLSDAKLAETGWKKRIPFNDSRTEVFYLGLTKDQRIHIGGGLADYEFNDGLETPANANLRCMQLREELDRIYPALREEPFEVGRLGKKVETEFDEPRSTLGGLLDLEQHHCVPCAADYHTDVFTAGCHQTSPP